MSHFDEFPTIECLKKYLHTLFRPNRKPVFNIYDPEGLQLLFQHRLGPQCPSNTIFLILHVINVFVNKMLKVRITFNSIPFYLTLRVTLKREVNDILHVNNLIFPENETHLYLYGHSLLDDTSNGNILKCSMRYIKATNRFSKM